MDNRDNVTLVITQSCNLSCTYCYEHHKSKAVMPLKLAKKLIRTELQSIKNNDGLELDLFGGEPFLEFELIKQITNFVQEECSIPFVIFATTNGTLVHGEIQEWLRDNKDIFTCGLSIDGTREMHNANRSNSYDMIDWPFFAELYPEQEIKMTISEATLPSLYKGVVDLHTKGFRVSCNLAYGIDWSQAKNIEMLDRELKKLVEYYVENPDVEPCSMLNMDISRVGIRDNETTAYCGAGLHMRTYDVDGQLYPCQYFTPLSVGIKKAREAQSIQFEKGIIAKELLDEKCRECIVLPICPSCYGANYSATGSIYMRDTNMCRLTKTIMKARAYFKARQWELGQLNETPDDLQALLRAIIRIQEELQV